MTGPDFIFMLTRGDVSVSDARAHVADAIEAGVRHIGFKDIGLPMRELRELAAEIRAGGATLYLEMVSLDAEAEAAGARAALALEVDFLMGGARPQIVEPILAGTPVRYYPFPGTVVGRPSRLEGGIEAIAESARRLASRQGVHGLDLLAYRFAGDTRDLLHAVCRAAGRKPVIAAGSIDSEDRIYAVAEAGVAGFTVGTAAFEGAFSAPPRLAHQLRRILATAESAGAARTGARPLGL